MIQRYGLVWEGMDVKNDKRDDAPYVLYTDHLEVVRKLEKEIKGLKKEMQRREDYIEGCLV